MGCGLLLIGATGCLGDSVEPGDYFVYRIASADQSMSESCDLTANEINDSSSLHDAGTFILFAGQEGDFYVDMGELTLEGEFKGDTDAGEEYEFSGKSVDIEWSDANGTGTKVSTTVEHDFELAIDGELVTGEYKVKTKVACTGEFCEGVPYSCTSTSDFVGTEVEDVDLEHKVN
jgi:hypothetical protein